MSKYRVVCGNLAKEAPYSSTEEVKLTIDNITDRTITVYAIDSRSNSTPLQEAVPNWINYEEQATRNISVSRENGVQTDTVLSFEGEIWKTEEQYDFGAVANEITECKYQYKKTNENNYGSEISINPTVLYDGSFSFNENIEGDAGANGFNLSNTYDVLLTIKDKIRIKQYKLLLGAGSPAMAIAHRRCSIWCTL